MNKYQFKITSVAITCILLILAGLQIFWLSRMYDSRREEFRQKINAAMERSAFEELSGREKYPAFVTTQISGMTGMPSRITITNTDSTSTTQPKTKSLNHKFSYAIQVNKKKNIIDIKKITNLYPDKNLILKYDTLLIGNLKQRDINLPYKLSLIDNSLDSIIYTANQIDLKNPLQFRTPYDSNGKLFYLLEIENPNKQLLTEMLWIILSSVLILTVLGFSFYYLLHTLFRQKTLEEIKSDFTRNITHELKTPIAVAAAANEVLLKFSADENPKKRHKYLTIIGLQLNTLTSMVERILSISQKEQEDFHLTLSGCNIKEILQELIQNYTLKYEEVPHKHNQLPNAYNNHFKETIYTPDNKDKSTHKHIRFHLCVVPDNLILQLDRFHFTNILGNLIDNAIKYSGTKVDITIEVDKNKILISDNGLGISQQDTKRIFDKYYRVPTGNLHNVKGFGLGLYYTRMIVEKHGGKIEVTSKSGVGSTFKITLQQLSDTGHHYEHQTI